MMRFNTSVKESPGALKEFPISIGIFLLTAPKTSAKKLLAPQKNGLAALHWNGLKRCTTNIVGRFG
jgi:hypothetical protein